MNKTKLSDIHRRRISIANRLRECRICAEITGRDLANRIGIPAYTLSKMEAGQQTIPVELLAAWCDALGISTNEALGIHETEGGSLAELVKQFRKLSSRGRELVLGHIKLVEEIERKNR
ncbi:helix-turn-helix domain-containing protein [Microbulbifer variabilis]|uniref:Helix-turn-helix domain-containing protein n=1 Tax=Microbulbifer variabilis TaxID=266805 RepID=A0ABY4V6I5_9GAMM|nr:helix-turn-helix transcriptional regulator [Microbulbifer variabilis]USD19782.1 helix-turn-helix domain-containing protein [Microbulbifer variabilis]